MKDVLQMTLAGILFLAVIFGIGWAVEGNSFFMYQFFAPKVEQVRHDTFKQSQAYNDGMAQDVNRVMLKYLTATPSEKTTLASYILSEVGSYDTRDLPTEQRLFIEKLKRGER